MLFNSNPYLQPSLVICGARAAPILIAAKIKDFNSSCSALGADTFDWQKNI